MRISAQLYTVRQLGDLRSQLDLVAHCGFADVETVGFHGLSVSEMTKQVGQSGLKVRSAHFEWEDFESRFEEIITLLKGLECRVAVMPWLAPEARPDTAQGWWVVSGQLANWAARLAEHGICLAYHNHDFEMVGPRGETPLDIILSRKALYWQPDIGWLASAVSEPHHLLNRYSNRITSAHAKDVKPRAGPEGDLWCAPGQGLVDWALVLQALADSACTDIFVEHDDTQNHSEILNSGRRFLRDRFLAGAG